MTTSVAAQWTLKDWLNDENQGSLFSSLLVFDRNADWFEINVRARGGQVRGKNQSTVDQRAVDLDVYVLPFNLHGEWETQGSTRRSLGLAVGLRLLGTSTRTTNVVVRYGWRNDHDDQLTPPGVSRRFVEGEAQLYVGRQFGLEGGYRHIEPKSRRITGGVFFEWQPVRLTFGYVTEVDRTSSREILSGAVKAFF